MIKDSLKTVDTCVAEDDQNLAEIDHTIQSITKKRKRLNAKLRKLRKMKTEIIDRRYATDCLV